MRKMGTSLNSSALKSDLAVIPKHHQTHPRFKALHFQTTYMNSKRKHSKHRNMYGKMYPDNNNYLHLNSLWSIWYGVLLTLFQGYLAIHGASRFLGNYFNKYKHIFMYGNNYINSTTLEQMTKKVLDVF